MNLSPLLPSVYLGSCPRTVGDVMELASLGISGVVNLQTADELTLLKMDWPHLQAAYSEYQIRICQVPIHNHRLDSLRANLPRAVQALCELLAEGRKVFVHCRLGKNRAPTVGIAYLHWVQKLPLGQATVTVWRCRRCEPQVSAIAVRPGE